MIASGLIFLFGFLAAALIALLVSPIVWRRAKRLARREFEATIPVSANEIRASYDHVRAQAAMESRRREMEAHAVREKAALERARKAAAKNATPFERALIDALGPRFPDAPTQDEAEFDRLNHAVGNVS